jgi:beta-lactamase regulating signal transducer with metallopeptidase domain
MEWAARSVELIWAASLAAVPVAIIAAVCCRWKWVRPATRHALWFAVLATLLSPVVIGLWRPTWFRSERVLAAADTAVETVIRSAQTAKSAYTALAPLDFDRTGVSTLLDQPETSSLIAIDPPRAAPAVSLADPIAVNRPESRPRREGRVDRQPARTDIVPVVAAHSAMESVPEVKTIPVSTRRSNRSFVGPPMPVTQSMLTEAELTMAPAPKSAAKSVRAAPVVARVSTFAQVRDWLGHMLAVRDAVASVPAIPPVIWIGGAAVLASLWLMRFVRVQRMLRRAEPAPEPLVALVRRLANVAGVKRVPETLIVDDRISPMIWCGLRPRLVIPRALWGELDARCQCAVIVHELSHLRRRDHRLCLLEAFIGLVYWWHPIAWWARHRLRDEAEACCDAWVTTLLPGGRRAYAEALVVTKSFLSVPGRSGAPGLGVVSGRTRQLARRITMVMTQRVAPRASLMGLAFALSVGAAGMFVMPGLACPPEDEKPSAQAKVVAKQKEAELKAKAKKDKPVKAQGQAFLGEAPALEAMRRGQAPPRAKQAEGQPLDGQMNALKDMERSLQQMEQRLKEMQRRLETMQTAPGAGPRSQGGGSFNAPRAAAGTATLRGLTVTPTPFATGVTVAEPRAGSPVAVAQAGGPTEGRDYSLPKGKLDALVALMARDDVPIFISSDGDSITVNATPQQHRIFQGFVAMIHPEGHSNAGANHLEHALREHAVAGQHAQASVAYRDAIRAQAEQLRSQARTLTQQRAASVRQSEQVKREIERARKNAEKAREKARKSGDDVEAEKAEEAVESQVEALECQLESIDCACDNFDCQIESIEEALQSLTQAIESADEVSVTTPVPALTPVAPMPPAAAAMPAIAPVPAHPASSATTPVPAAPPASPAPAAAPAPGAPPAPPTPPMTTAGAPTAR